MTTGKDNERHGGTGDGQESPDDTDEGQESPDGTGDGQESPDGSIGTVSSDDERTAPKPLTDHVDVLAERIRRAPAVLVCLDFDGTLARIVDDPEDATIAPEADTALSALESVDGISTAVVSGRSLSDLRHRVDVTTLAGNHGLELERDGSVSIHPIAAKQASRLASVCTSLEIALDPIPNVRIENKRLTATVHVRTVPDALHPIVGRIVRHVTDHVGTNALSVSTGKCVFELGPDVPWGKGEAVVLLASTMPENALVVYIGDDVTDESAFRVLEKRSTCQDGTVNRQPVSKPFEPVAIESIRPSFSQIDVDGVTIRVGDDRPSDASYRIDSVSDVASILTVIAALVDRTDGSPDRATTDLATVIDVLTGSVS